jgi:hypothetical protein
MKKTIHYALILDQSGSMQQLRQEVISSFNEQAEMIFKLQKTEPEVEIKITLCTFNDEVSFKYIAQKIDLLKKLTTADYQPDSCTALYDAIGITMLKVNEIKQLNDQVFLAIFTDGLENASTIYTAKDISHKLKKAEKDGWEVKFFCRYEDSIHYKQDLDLSPDLQFCLSLNEDGIKAMENEVMYRINRMVKSKKDMGNDKN